MLAVPPSPRYDPVFTTDTGSLSGRPLFDPEKILKDYRVADNGLGSDAERINHFQCDYIYAPLAMVMQRRGNPIDHDNPVQRMKAILDRVNGHDDRCKSIDLLSMFPDDSDIVYRLSLQRCSRRRPVERV